MIRYYQISHYTGVDRKEQVQAFKNFIKAHWGKIAIGVLILMLSLSTATYFGWQKVKQWRATRALQAQQTATSDVTAPKEPVKNGLEERFETLNRRLAQIERERDEAHRREVETGEKLIIAANQLDKQNIRLARSAQVRRPTKTAGSERVTFEPEQAPSRHETRILEYVWTTRDQVGSISLLPGEAATVRITDGVRFVVDPDPGLDIKVILANGTEVPFAEWKKNPTPVRRFEISNNGDEGRVALFVPNN